MENIGKLISGISLLAIGIFISYEAYVYMLKDIILVTGALIALVGVIVIISYVVDSSINKSNNRFQEYIKSSNFFNNSGVSKNDKPLKIRTEFDNYEEEYYDEDVLDDVYYNNNIEVEDTPNFGKTLEFSPNYDKPVKITRTPKKREKSLFGDDNYTFDTPQDKTDSIKKALSEETEPTSNLRPKIKEHRDIRIDVNDPEALPIPKGLNSYIIDDNQIITSQDAFDKLGSDIKKEVMLEIPSLNELSDRFLSHIPSIYSRVIIEDFDVSNISYMLLVASLLNQGVHIKTMDKVNTINLITDDSTALILSKGRKYSDVEYGAIYSDRNVLSEIRETFDKTWEIAKDLDENILLQYANQEGI